MESRTHSLGSRGRKIVAAWRDLAGKTRRQQWGSPARSPLARAVLLGALLSLVPSSQALAFNSKSHIAIANRAMAGLKNAASPYTSATISLTNLGDVLVQNPVVVQAVQLCPEYFRGGSLGPDIFPDLFEGQLYVHPNQGRAVCSTECIASRGTRCEQSDRDNNCLMSNVPLELRPADRWRSIDYGMYQLRKALDYTRTPGSDPCTPKLQAVAFAYGYLSHGIGDGFAHSYVNEWTRAVAQLTSGAGIFGTITQVMQHGAIEDYMDKHLNVAPADVNVSWPTDFLTDLYTGKLSGPEVAAATGADAGTFAGPFPTYTVKIRDVLNTMAHRQNWAAAMGGAYGDIAADLLNIQNLYA